MKFRRYIAFSIYFVAATQQQLPSCAQTCLNRTPTTCLQGDTLCRCSSAEFVSGLSCCIIVNCGPVDQEAARARLSAQCLSVGVTVPSTATCPSTSRTSSSVSTAQPATTSSTPPPLAPVTDSGTPSSSGGAAGSNTGGSSPVNPSRTGTGIGVSGSSTSTSTPSPTPSSSSSSLSPGAIAGTAVGALIGVAILILAVVLARRRRPPVDKRTESPSLHGPEFGDTILESDLVQIPQQFITPVQQPAIAELPSPVGPPKTGMNGSPHGHPAISELGLGLGHEHEHKNGQGQGHEANVTYRGSREMTPTTPSVPTTAVSELPSERDGGEGTFDSRELSPISPVSRTDEPEVTGMGMGGLNGYGRGESTRSRGT